jgi:hypothetical protein
MNINEIPGAMRALAVIPGDYHPDADLLNAWADALEQAMREPVAWQDTTDPSVIHEHDNLDPMWHGIMRPLFALPPDMAAEIERLTKQHDYWRDKAKEGVAEIERLEASFRQLLSEAETVMAAYGTTNLAAVLSARFVADFARAALKEDKA